MEKRKDNMVRLPIGTLVTIEHVDYPLLIIGHEYFVKHENRNFNYLGLIYPIGLLPDSDFVFFDFEQIEQIVQLGYMHEDHVLLSDMLDMETKTGIYRDVTNLEEEINDVETQQFEEEFTQL